MRKHIGKPKYNSFLNFIKSPPVWLFILLAAVFVFFKLMLASAQQVYLDPDEALLDDMMMYDSAVSITKGDWLGEYNWMTLSKHKFFSLWLALLHVLRIPYLMGGQILWLISAGFAAWAFAPVLKSNWLKLGLFAALVFNPASVANATPLGFVTRVYRDNIFPALCLMCVTGVAALALRHDRPAKGNIGWAVLSGLSFAACWLSREDGWWLLPFVLVASIVTLVFILRGEAKNKLRRGAVLLVPFIVLSGGIATWGGINYAYYGRFIVSDFSSGEFADAYGAMTRIQLAEWDPNTCVPYETRRFLYDNIPEFAPLEEYLESYRYQEKYGGLESGGYYWALREAAAEIGVYETPESARIYFEKLAKDINALCDSGAVPSGGSRSSVSPPIDMRFVPGVLKEGVYSLWFCATYQQCEPYSMRSAAAQDTLIEIEDFLYEKSLTAAVENTDQPYFMPVQKLAFAVLQVIRYIYAIITPLALVVSLAWLVIQLIKMLKKKAEKGSGIFWWVMFGILLCAFLRVFMIGFVNVSSFSIGTYVMYLATVHPLLIIFAFVGCMLLCGNRWAFKKKESK